ncbi:hypothetical protein [uncultured Mediterranean phage uvMED]|nr:hypothetical protein [uncultured Mediterranean phage uvMED]BAQ84915.1 hypothetical protein [uncultured Mediterranean phage uvMED]BAR13780.1 hypothetical protein [uncultured Mediterranean phage uvMED]BAR14861.1 hypothetical protein [uncultured Mediterranean phage uvMED]
MAEDQAPQTAGEIDEIEVKDKWLLSMVKIQKYF